MSRAPHPLPSPQCCTRVPRALRHRADWDWNKESLTPRRRVPWMSIHSGSVVTVQPAAFLYLHDTLSTHTDSISTVCTYRRLCSSCAPACRQPPMLLKSSGIAQSAPHVRLVRGKEISHLNTILALSTVLCTFTQPGAIFSHTCRCSHVSRRLLHLAPALLLSRAPSSCVPPSCAS